jgi:hypothetical protein
MAGQSSGGAAIKPTVAFQSNGPAATMNMGGLRGTATADIAVTASPPLPAAVAADEITLSIPARFARTGAGLGTDYLPRPTFTTPEILEHGALVTFTLCVDASHIAAGSYVGQVIVGGPVGVQPASVAISLNAKDNTLFIVGIVLASLAAFALLVFRGIKVKHAVDSQTLGNAFRAMLKDYLGFWAPTVIAIAGAVVAMLQVYDGNPAWGADKVSSFIALATTAITAAGVGTFLSSLSKS